MKKIKQFTELELTPIDLYYRLKDHGTCLFERHSESVDYSIIAFAPVERLSFQDNQFQIGQRSYPCSDPLKELESYVLKEEDGLALPFQGGALGYVGYDVAACYEEIGTIPKDELEIPDLQFYLYETFVVYEAPTKAITLVVGNTYSQTSEVEF